MTGAISCEACGQSFSQATATYSPAGQLVCPACASKGVLAANLDRAAASRRSTRIVFIVSGVLVVAVPAIMLAAGAGKYLAMGLIGLGVLLLIGGRQAFRMAGSGTGDPGVRRGAFVLMLVGVVAIAAGAGLQNVVGH
jgi:hypothetical protein